MTLPKLETATYKTELPITKKKIEYRPFLVKEQKVLLIALESEEEDQANNSMLDLVGNCVLNRDSVGNLEELPMMDLEFLFVQIRIKSVGETVDVAIHCDECDETTPVTIDLSEASVSGTIPEPKIELLNDIGMTLSYPTLATIKDQGNMGETETIFNMIYNSVENIYNGDEVWTKDDIGKEDLEEFLDQFTTDQFKKVQDYFMNMPRYSKQVSFDCSKCSVKNEKELTGVMDFFG